MSIGGMFSIVINSDCLLLCLQLHFHITICKYSSTIQRPLAQFKIQPNSGQKFHETNAVQFVLLCVLLLIKNLESLLFSIPSLYAYINGCQLSDACSFLETTKIHRQRHGYVTTHFERYFHLLPSPLGPCHYQQSLV